LSATGKGHGTERASLAGLVGKERATVDPLLLEEMILQPRKTYPEKLGDTILLSSMEIGHMRIIPRTPFRTTTVAISGPASLLPESRSVPDICSGAGCRAEITGAAGCNRSGSWSGIALHGGPLPGSAASHGCVRMSYDFAEKLFEKTRIGMRVIIAPNDAEPVEFTHPALFVRPCRGCPAARRKVPEREQQHHLDKGQVTQGRQIVAAAAGEGWRGGRLLERLRLQGSVWLAAVRGCCTM
jgi:hypothetical protein